MAVLYMRPTADIYVNHKMVPEGSANGYALINEVTSDGSATYIGTTVDTADTRVTKSSSFVLAGVDMPLDEFRITDLAIVVKYSQPSSGTYEFLSSYTVTSNGITGVSDVCSPSANTWLSSTSTLRISSFDRNGQFLQMFNEYTKANGKTPNVEIAVTTHCKSSKSSASFYITQLYLQVTYNTLVYKKLPVKTTTVTGSFGIQTTITTGGWTQAKVYKKTNGVWSAVRNGRSQVGMQLNKIGHELVAMPYKSPTCVETGLTEGSKCSCCGIVYKEQEVVAAKGHTPTTVEASGATCVKDGYTGGERCSVCNAAISGSIIPATGNHTPTDVAATEPTCLLVGYTAGKRCSVCQTYLSGHETIPKTDNHTPTDVAATEPTCGAVGYTAGTQCSVCSKYLSGHEQIPATGNHTYVDNGDGVAETQIDMGLTSRTICSVCGHVLVDYTTIPMLGHTCTPVTIPAVAANCTHTGLTEGKKCSVCGKVLDAQEVVPATGVHTPVTIPAVAPTCVATGLTAGQKCSVCGKVLDAQEVVPATGNHNYVTSNIQSHKVCATCGYIKDSGFANLVYNGTIDSMSHDRCGRAAATTVGDYALFGGGAKATGTVDIYDKSLIHSTTSGFTYSATATRYTRRDLAATTVGNYALFGGGYSIGENVYDVIDVYGQSLVHSTTALSLARGALAATTVGDYALFAGGFIEATGSGNERDTVDAYNQSLTHNTTSLSYARSDVAATTVGDYALFAGGENYVNNTAIVDVFNAALTRSIATELRAATNDSATTTVGNYAIFVGGYQDHVRLVTAYNQSLTRISCADISDGKYDSAATAVGNYAIFGTGGYKNSTVDVFTQSLTHSTIGSAGYRAGQTSATTVGDYALFGGDNGSTIVEAYGLQFV